MAEPEAINTEAPESCIKDLDEVGGFILFHFEF